jgi:hypothetical protein
MNDGFVVGIVKFESLGERAVGEGRSSNPNPISHAQNPARSWRSGNESRCPHRAAKFRFCTGKGKSDNVQDTEARRGDDILGKVLKP